VPLGRQEAWLGRRGYPPEFRRKVLDLLQAGGTVADVARDLQLSQEKVGQAADDPAVLRGGWDRHALLASAETVPAGRVRATPGTHRTITAAIPDSPYGGPEARSTPCSQ
jgi:hypothetical protein